MSVMHLGVMQLRVIQLRCGPAGGRFRSTGNNAGTAIVGTRTKLCSWSAAE